MAVQGYKLFKVCDTCGGTGKQKVTTGENQSQEIECPCCTGHGVKLFGYCSGDLFDMPTPEE